ncbi:MAG: sodium-dependent transporter [Eubacterium aggregans]|uniref:sodium-dependent transporter n=1 Tax=Eubacterium aggregans TaxID=81409 RepID=UPI0023F1995E|nr:sodium-dependent transporter [Eubacterium aggregans]MDD4691095.1 sodium-dependent transporter [Eubacterium aggregans]MEA5073846.1 sodium-dependent transporter [Eubacterium aggregans]
MEKRSSFSSKLGFIMAAAGSSVGLGNIWRFPYLAAKYGGGIFLLFYILFVVTLGFTIMAAELAIGRHTRLSPSKAYGALKPGWNIIGIIGMLVAFLIFPYYSVIGGWVIKYTADFVMGAGPLTAADDYFSSYIAQPIMPILLQILFVVITAVIVVRGVKEGIEKTSKVLMPILIVLSVIIAVYSVCQPGAWEGVKYYLWPNMQNFSFQGVLGAMGQMFYSLSLAMGIMITYGSYMKKDDPMESAVKQVELFDFGIAFLAGFMVIPAVFAFSGGNPDALNKGAGLMFVTLPKVFESMGMGSLMGALFFVLVLFAALTSSISLLEAVVASVHDGFGWSRNKAVLIISGMAILLGIPSSLSFGLWSNVTLLGMGFFDFFDFITNSVLMPVGAILTCIFVGHLIDTKVIVDEIDGGSGFKRKKMFVVMIKYIAPICIVAILISSILEGMGIIVY